MSNSVLGSIAIVVALGSLVLNILQWLSRRRPYLGIVSLEWDTIDIENSSYSLKVHGKEKWYTHPDSVKCTIRNVGEVPAKQIEFDGKTTILKATKELSKGLGILLPTQEMEVNVPLHIDRDTLDLIVSGHAAAKIETKIRYRGTLPFSREFRTEQNAVLRDMPKRSFFLPGGNAT